MKNKTQKNWKEIRNMAIFIIIICAGLFSVFHILSLNYLNKQDFNITKEECWNEEIFLYKYNRSVFRIAENEFGEKYNVFNNSYLNEIEVSENTFVFLDDWKYVNIVGSYDKHDKFVSKKFLRVEEICKQVEVDKEYVDNLPINEEIIINLALLTYFDIGNKEGWFSEWLDENCESELYYNSQEDSKYLIDTSQKQNLWEYEVCTKYKCGDFQVEVLK